MNKIKIYYIQLSETIFLNEVKDKLIQYGYEEFILNDFNFCPFLIIHNDFETHKGYYYQNINPGYMHSILLSDLTDCIGFSDINKFLEYALKFKTNKDNNALF